MVLANGKCTLLDRGNPKVYAYTKELNNKKILVLLNFFKDASAYQTELDLKQARILLGNYPVSSISNHLNPYEALILELQNIY